MKRILAYLLFAITVFGQKTENNLTVRTNLIAGKFSISSIPNVMQGSQLLSDEQDLATTDPAVGYFAVVKTGTAAGHWYWDSTSTATDGDGVISALGYATGRWLRLVGLTVPQDLSANKAVVIGSDKSLQQSVTTLNELSYLSGATNVVQSQINKRLAKPTATTLYTLGDSIANGSAATTFSEGWSSLLASQYGLAEQRLAYGSSRIIDYWWQSQPPFIYTNSFAGNIATAPSSISSSQVWAIGMGDYNGMRDYGTSAAYQTHSARGFESLLVALTTPSKRTAAQATQSGTWATMTNLGGIYTATNSSSTLTFTNIIGDVVYVAYIASVSNDFGGISVSVDGTSYGSWSSSGAYGNRELDNGTDANIPDYIAPYGNGKLWYLPYVARIPVGTSTKHTVVVTASGASIAAPSGVLWVTGNSQRSDGVNVGPIALVSGTLRQATYTGSGSDIAAGQFCSFIQKVIATLWSDGLPVYYVPTEQWFDEFTQMSGDNVHPSVAGHARIAAAFYDTIERVLNPKSSQGLVAKSKGLSIGGNAARGGTINLSPGDSLTWRNSSGFDGVSITNSGTALEIDAPNSSGSIIRSYLWRGDAFPMKSEDYATFAAGSPVGSSQTVTFGLSSGTAVLNQHTVTEAQSGTGGFAIHDTALTRSSSGSGESSIYRAQVGGRNVFRVTAGGRLLVDTATAGTGTSSRFGAGNDSTDSVLISYGTAAANRVLNIGSGAIEVTLNDGTASNVRLPIQASGGDTSFGTFGSSSGSGVSVTQSATDRRMVIASGSSIDVVLNSTGATGQPLTINGSGGSVFLGASGTSNQALSWSGGTGLDRRMQIGGNTIQVSLNSNGSSYQNLAVQTLGGDLVVGSSSSTGIRLRSSGGAAIFSGTGTPEGAVTAPVGSLFLRTDGGAGTTLYVKESGTGNTGWVGK